MEGNNKDKALQYKNQGNEFFKRKDYNKAIEAYTKAINLNPMDATYYGNRAACYFNLRNYSKCISDCNDALDIDSKFAKAWARKGRSLYYLARFDEAKECLKKAKELDSSDKSLTQEIHDIDRVKSLWDEAENYYKNTNFKKALENYKQILMICPDIAKAKIRSIETLAKTGDTKLAMELINRYAPELSGDVDFLYAKGLTLCYSGQIEAGKRAWVEAAKLDPDNTECKNAIKVINRQEEAKEKGNAAFKSGDNQGAVNHYSVGINLDPFNMTLTST